jgi:hypothetical protein
VTTYGVTDSGFVAKPLSVIVTDIENDILSSVATNVDLDPNKPLGQLIAIMAKHLDDAWQMLGTIYKGRDRTKAVGKQLDNIGSLIGLRRQGESASAVYCTVVFNVPGTYVAGSLVAFLPKSTTVQFYNESDIVVPTKNLDGSTVGPNSLIGLTVPFVATVVGPAAGLALIAANADAGLSFGALSGMVPITGWVSVNDVGAPVLGALVETDAAYAARQVTELSAPGACTLDATAAAIVAALAAAPHPSVGVIVKLNENTTLLTDSSGLPGKSYEAVIFDGLAYDGQQNDQLIAQAIWDNKPSGLVPFGRTSSTAVDANGQTHAVAFTRPTRRPVYTYLSVAVSPADLAQADAIKAAVAAAIVSASQGLPYGIGSITAPPSVAATLVPGGDVVANAIRMVASAQAGVIDVPAFAIGFAPSPSGAANLAIAPNEIAVLETPIVDVTLFVP